MIALVTGASAGFGRSICRLLVKRGHRVIGAARRESRLQALKTELGDLFYSLVFDITDKKAMYVAIDSLPEDLQAIDLLVNNAGLALGLKPAHQADIEDWEQMIATNISGLVSITRKILPAMVARNRGHVINLSSIAASWPYFGGNVYGASKAFVRQLSLNLRTDLAGTRVRVTSVEPGNVGGTEFSEVRYHGDAAAASKVYEGFETMTPDDIADIVVWIAEQPERVNVNSIEIMPVAQTFGGLTITRE